MILKQMDISQVGRYLFLHTRSSSCMSTKIDRLVVTNLKIETLVRLIQLYGIWHANRATNYFAWHTSHKPTESSLLFNSIKGNVDKTFQFATGVTSTDWFVTWNCLDYIIVGRLAAACVCSHCHISPLTNAKATMTDGCRAIWYNTSPCFLCFLFSLSLIPPPACWPFLLNQ